MSAESPDCGSSGRGGGRGGGGGGWVLGLLCLEEAPCLPPTHPHPHCHLGIAVNHSAAEFAPGRGERCFLLPQPSLLPVLPGASRPQFLQNGAAGPISPSQPLLVPACSPRSSAAPLPGDPQPALPPLYAAALPAPASPPLPHRVPPRSVAALCLLPCAGWLGLSIPLPKSTQHQ